MKAFRQQLPLFLVLALLGALAWFSLTRVQFSASVYELLPQDLAEVQGMDRLNRYFNRDGQLIVTVRSQDAHLTAQTAAMLAEKLRKTPSLVAAVREELPLDRLAREGGSLLAWLWLNAEPSEVEELSRRLEAPNSGKTIAEVIALIEEGLLDGESIIRSHDPLALARLPQGIRSMEATDADAMRSKDGLFRLFYVEGKGVVFSDYREAAAWLDAMKGLLVQWRELGELAEDVEIGLTGTPAFMAEVGRDMERDMSLSVVSTMALISILFWIMHRQSQPLGWLIAALFLVLIVTLNAGSLLFGKLSVMSAGFAAILLGLTVDYGIILYRAAMTGLGNARALRQVVGPSIAWAAASTAVVFLSLNFSSLPGLAELGNLVALGVTLGAFIMLWGFGRVAVKFALHLPPAAFPQKKGGPSRSYSRWLALLVPILAVLSVMTKDFPHLEPQFHPFRIRESPSMTAWKVMQHQLRGEGHAAVPVVMTAPTLPELEKNLANLEERLSSEKEAGVIQRFSLPFALIPRSAHQSANRPTLSRVIAEKDRLLAELDAAGFSGEGQALTREVIESWERSLQQLSAGASFAMPSGSFAEWTVSRLFFRNDTTFAALGVVLPTDPADRGWVEAIFREDNAAAASLASLGAALNHRIGQDINRVFVPMLALLAAMLGIVFRCWKDWLLALFTLFFAACVMILVTLWTPLSWNSFNICGLPLIFGTGLDFGIHMIFALRRSQGQISEARHHVGKALLFCGISSAIGFGSLAFASARGLASLGQVCLVGILVNMVIAVWLLPHWFRLIHGLERK